MHFATKEKEIYGYQTLYREIGYYIKRLERYKKSVTFFDEALKKTPDDIRALRGRSIARAKASLLEGALEDVNKALKLDPENLRILADKALNTYLNCEFEDGLIQNSRMLPIRQKPNDFALGVMYCSDAISNCIGERAGRPLRDHFKIIRKLAWKRHFEQEKLNAMDVVIPPRVKKKKNNELFEDCDKSKKKQYKDDENGLRVSLTSYHYEKEAIPPLGTEFPFRPLQHYTTNIQNYMAERYLDCMYLDKIFLKNIPKLPGTMSPNQQGYEKIIKIANGAYKEVSYKQEQLRTRRPFYYIKFQEVQAEGALKERKKAELLMTQQTIRKEANAILNRMDKAYHEKNLSTMLLEVNKLKDYCNSKPKRLFPERDEYKKKIFDYVCNGYYEINRMNHTQYEWDQEKRIIVYFDLPISREPSRDSVIEYLKPGIQDYNKLISAYEGDLKSAEEPSEICWYYYELCKCSIMLKQWDQARIYAKKCIQEGKQKNILKWMVNATLLSAKISVLQQNKSDAIKELESAYEIAKVLEDTTVMEYLQGCLKVINKIEFDNMYGPKVVEERQKKIVSMMGNLKLKDEMAYIFRAMASMPSCRRLNIMPGVQIHSTESTKKQPKAKAQRKATERGSESRKSKQKKSKGVGFMDLVEYHLE